MDVESNRIGRTDARPGAGRVLQVKRLSLVARAQADWLLWGRMTSSGANDSSGEWAPPTGTVHPDRSAPPGSGTDQTTPAPVPPDQAVAPQVAEPAGGSGIPQSLSPPPTGAQATVILDDPQSPRRSRTPLIVVGALVLLAMFLLLADWAARNVEAMQLFDQIEKSEAAMGETQSATVEVARSAPKGTFPLPPNKKLPPDVASDLEAVSSTGHDAVAAAGQDVAAVSFLPWHSDLIAAQASYLQHNRAWVNHLKAGSKEGEVLIRGDDAEIESTWHATEGDIRAAIPIAPFPGITDRVDTIFEEEPDESSGPTLDVSGPNRASGPGESLSPFLG